ncbi:MAG: HAD-IA family hydrolase [Methylovirgula sp.]|nr:HAD-IA family hydrolase [Methylovirgula sp.]
MSLIIFDCDGVLVDSEVIAFDVLAQMLAAFGRPMSFAECRRRFMGRRTSEVLAEIEKDLGHSIPPDLGTRMKAMLFARLRQELQPVAGVKATLAQLPQPICVASSSAPDRIALSLKVTGLAPIFGDHVFSAEQVAHGKPAPDLFLFAAKSMGVPPQDAIVIEDSPAGVTAARRAGMGIIGFAGASHADGALAAALREAGAESVVTDMADLPAAIDRLRAARAAA